MYIPEFSIPLNRDDLCHVTEDGSYYVKYLLSPKEIQEKLEDAKDALSNEGLSFIVDHFPTFFSLFKYFKQISELNCQRAWSIISKSIVELIANLNNVLDDVKNMEYDIKNDMRNITKMLCYVLVEFLVLLHESTGKNDAFLDLKGKKKQKPADSDIWQEDKLKILNELYTLLQLPIKLLWDPPIVDEDFVNLIANFCYKCLEDSNITHANMKWVRETIFQIFGTLIKNYLHGLSFCVKVVQLLKSNEHVVNPIAKGTVQLVKECKCTNIVKEIVREIAETDCDQLVLDTSGTKSLNMFLVQLAESIPETIIPAIDLLLHHLAGDSYTMRMCVLEVLGEIVLTTLSKENMDEDLKSMRDEYLACLEDHIHDVNAFVRSKVLQIWQKLCLLKSIPILRLNHLLELTIGRLNDKSTHVKKQAVHLIKDLLETNPYASQLDAVEIENQMKDEMNKIESLKKTHNVDIRDADSEWKEIEPKLKEIIAVVEEEHESLQYGENCVDDINLEKKLEEIGNCLLSGKYNVAVEELATLKYKCNAALNLDREDVDLIVLLQKLFSEKVGMIMINLPLEVQEKLNKCRATIEYLENALKFAKLIDIALPKILTLLDSNVVTIVLESINFFTAAYLFGFHQALEGVRKMLYLMYSKEEVVKSAVSDAYQNIYFEKKVQGRHQSISTIKNLTNLILKLNDSQLKALEFMVRKWVKEGLIDSNCIQVMFERFSRKIPNTSEEEMWAALALIRMVGAEEPRVIKSNISVLLSQGLSNTGNKNLLIGKEVCKALAKLLPEKQPGRPIDQSLRYSYDHEIFIILYKFLRDTLWRTQDAHYIPMAEEGINLVFQLCDKPDSFCEKLIADVHHKITTKVNPLKEGEKAGKKLTHTEDTDELLEDDDMENMDRSEVENERTNDDSSEKDIMLLTRFISILGQVAANYILYLEGPILNELKRRNQVDFERKIKKLKSRKCPEISSNDSLNKSEQDAGQDLDFNRAAADDMDAEEMRKKTENELVTGTGYFAKFSPLILAVCKNPGKFNNTSLQNSALLALSKYMMVSSIFCEENVQLLVTICEKSHCPLRRKNAIIALGSLQYRFPNILEPWTSHMFGVLRDSDSTVRHTAVMILTDLIVNEMIKVRSNISDLAVCIVDKDNTIAKTVRHFFREYSLKGNSLFNVLPCLISNVISPDLNLTEDEFKTMMRFIFGLFTKDKQVEYLIDKLFQYFESATTERQWKDIAFCLSLLNYNEKSLKKISDNLRYFGNKLYLADVYESFCIIINNAAKNPQKDKILIKEIQDLIKECREKSCRDKNVTLSVHQKMLTIGSTTKKVQLSSTKKHPISNSESKEVTSKRQLIKVKDHMKEKENEGDEPDDDDNAFLSDFSYKKSSKTRHRNSKKVNKESVLSDEDSESSECCRKKTKNVKHRLQAKKLKSKRTYLDDGTSEEEEKPKTDVRITRKRK